jgi:hypothetical protein
MSGEIIELNEEGGKSRLHREIMSSEISRYAEGCAKRNKIGQSSMLMVVIVIMMFVGVAVLLLGITSTVSGNDLTSLYVNNMVLSMMRTDTGYTDSKCKLVSDLVFCAYFTPEWQCGPGVPNCLGLANETISRYMAIIGNQTKSMKYLFTVTPAFMTRDVSGEPISLDIGDKSLKTSKTESIKLYSNPIVLSKTVGSNQYTLKIQLIASKK